MDTHFHDGNNSEIYCELRQDTQVSRVQQHYDWVPHMPYRQNSSHSLPDYRFPPETHSDFYNGAPVSIQRPNQGFNNCNDLIIERTPAGNSILSTLPFEPLHTISDISEYQQRDLSTAARVQSSFQRRLRDSKYERILRGLIRRHDPLDSGFMLDDSALESILTAADSIFFDGALAGRVRWEWSSERRYQTEIIGTTALRCCTRLGGFETLIILSEPLLRNEKYDRRLLLTTFLHELIHCYLFITCGFEARMEGGHSAGFHRIAKIIDSWVGPGFLSICKMRENPEDFCIHNSLDNRKREFSNYMQQESSEREKNLR